MIQYSTFPFPVYDLEDEASGDIANQALFDVAVALGYGEAEDDDGQVCNAYNAACRRRPGEVWAKLAAWRSA